MTPTPRQREEHARCEGQSWTQLPEARALLESCAARPPKLIRHRKVYAITTDEWLEYVGPRAERLEAIREKHLCELSGADWNASNPDAAACKLYMALHEEQPTVVGAIGAAIEAGEARGVAA